MFVSPFRLHRFSLAAICLWLVLNGISAITTQAQARAYVTNFCSNTIAVIDVDTNTVVTTIPVGLNPFGVTITPDGARELPMTRWGFPPPHLPGQIKNAARRTAAATSARRPQAKIRCSMGLAREPS